MLLHFRPDQAIAYIGKRDLHSRLIEKRTIVLVGVVVVVAIVSNNRPLSLSFEGEKNGE